MDFARYMPEREVTIRVKFYTLVVITVLLALGFIAFLLVSLSRTYDQSIQRCVDNGFPRDYCESLLY